ncbi:type VI secretion system Vgr family protein [Myxococcus stipitatus]|uniref:type VI secretion system Vgr family protein n=1 Tax=Myxococcus stipitatus TaxID=83455 RepID=UPI0030D03C9D
MTQVASPLVGTLPLPEVRFEFESQGTPHIEWHVRKLHLEEGLSQLYTLTLELIADAFGEVVDALWKSSCELRMWRGGQVRRVLGLASKVSYLGSHVDKVKVRVVVVPAAWVLTQRKDSFIFQERSVPDVLEEVLEESLAPFKRKVRLETRREYPKREYCCQYKETDWDFCVRLLHEEGIAFRFEHDGDAEVLVLTDENSTCPPCALEGGAVWVANEAGALASTETVRTLHHAREMTSEGVVVREMDWSRPSLELEQAHPKDAAPHRTLYAHNDASTVGGWDGVKFATDEVGRSARRLHEEQVALACRGMGEGCVSVFTPGHTFNLQGHERAELNRAFLLTRVTHTGEAPEESIHATSGKDATQGPRYSNTFECIPLDVPFRPRAPEKPRPLALRQTATVVGPPGEEVHTDKYNRVKVLMHWDREGKRDDKSSCWMRVQTPWAGPGYGFLATLRVGMEVVVEFFDGNPDRPMVTGAAFNGENTPPHDLPEKKTRLCLRSASSPGGDGYNELAMEDAAGQEELHLHAQRDLTEVVKNEHSTEVASHQTNKVKGNQTEEVGGAQTVTVMGHRFKVVKENETHTVEKTRTTTIHLDDTKTIHGNRTTTVDKNESHTVQGERMNTVVGKETAKLEAGRETTVTGNDILSISVERRVTVDGKDLLVQGGTRRTFEGGNVTLVVAGNLVIQCGGAEFSMDKSGNVEVMGARSITLKGGECALSMKDGKAHLDAPRGACVTSGTTTLDLQPTSATLSGNKLTTSATGEHEVTGNPLKVN